MKTKLEGYISRYIWRQLVCPILKTQGDRTSHVRECCSQHGRRDHMLKEMAPTGQAGTLGSVLQITQCCQVSHASVNYCVTYK
jgi:hypothetical protein